MTPTPDKVEAPELLAVERDEALAFARREAARNGELTARVERYENRERRDFEALRRIRDTLKASGFYGGSYLGLRDPETQQYFGDAKRTPAIEIIEQYIAHLATRTPDERIAGLVSALKAARAALHQHYVDWDGEPEDAVPLQLARAECDQALATWETDRA